uniref:Protein phosphatase 1 regulatory subunit 37 n=1 Tax=Oryzias sinensis TaxID=183150 RepID=A0A8C8DPZ3_9TELE
MWLELLQTGSLRRPPSKQKAIEQVNWKQFTSDVFLPQGGGVGGSVERLDLKGERLDHRSCEALEAVLKSLHFDFINLQAAQLEENGASSLLDMILYYESTTYLDISDNASMGTSAWRALAHLIKQSVRLSRLDVCNVSLVDYPARSLSKALLTSRLSVLHLHNAQLSGTPLFTLVGALKHNRALQELHLTNNLLNSYQDSMQLGDLLRFNTTIHTLELSNNMVADAGLEELCDGLSRQTEGLKVLKLRNNNVTKSGMEHLAKALPVLKVLQVLDLGENSLGNEAIQVIREPLIANNTLKHLGLAQTNITCEGAVALAEFIVESRQIHKLDLSQNPVRLGGLMALSLSLRINRSLAFLDVNPVPPEEQNFNHLQNPPLSQNTIQISPVLFALLNPSSHFCMERCQERKWWMIFSGSAPKSGTEGKNSSSSD